MKLSAQGLLFGVSVPVRKLLEADNLPSPIALGDSLGDRYLCRHNPVYAGVRTVAIGMGYRFSSDGGPLHDDYVNLPLTTLHRILGEKTIPYSNTAATLLRLLETNPDASLPTGFLLDNTKRNYVMHESAHCVTHGVLDGTPLGESLSGLYPDERDRTILEGVFAEAFANTVEKLATIHCGAPLWDYLFFCLNSYVGPDEELVSALKNVSETLGGYRRFAVLFLASFAANLTLDEPDEPIIRTIASISGCSDGNEAVVGKLIASGFKLSKVFREYTGPAYFEYLGLKEPFSRLRRSLWLQEQRNQAFVRELMPALFTLIDASATGTSAT